MIIDEQVEDFKDNLNINDFGVAENIKEALEQYENGKWIKFDQEDGSTWPLHNQLVIVFETDIVNAWPEQVVFRINGFHNMNGGKFIPIVTHWQRMPESPKSE